VKRSRGYKRHAYRDVELNIMPFIDVFSMLNTFLLYSAVFLAVGIIEVQVPFLSNAAPPSKETREFSVKVDVENSGKVTVTSSYSQPPAEEVNRSFDSSPAGLTEMHSYLVGIRKSKPDTDKVTLFCGNEVTYEKLALVLDAVKLRRSGDPTFQNTPSSKSEAPTVTSGPGDDIFPKIVMGSVMLKGGSE
jgi:biopolymer transport protein ExbD